MREEIKKLWVAALKSGDYIQGKEALHTTNGVDKFCCLGVLTDLFIHSEEGEKIQAKWRGLTEEEEIENSELGEFTLTYDSKTNIQYVGDVAIVLPGEVQEWADLYSENPLLMDGDSSSYDKCAAQLNDNGKSFEEIADLIEANL